MYFNTFPSLTHTSFLLGGLWPFHGYISEVSFWETVKTGGKIATYHRQCHPSQVEAPCWEELVPLVKPAIIRLARQMPGQWKPLHPGEFHQTMWRKTPGFVVGVFQFEWWMVIRKWNNSSWKQTKENQWKTPSFKKMHTEIAGPEATSECRGIPWPFDPWFASNASSVGLNKWLVFKILVTFSWLISRSCDDGFPLHINQPTSESDHVSKKMHAVHQSLGRIVGTDHLS